MPGGPHKIIDGNLSWLSKERNTLPSAKRCCCPTNWSSVLGRNCSAKGAREVEIACDSEWLLVESRSNKFIGDGNYIREERVGVYFGLHTNITRSRH